MARAEHGAKSMGGEAECYGRPVCFCVLACTLQQPFRSRQSFALCVRGTYKYEHSNACSLKPQTVVPRCASHMGEEKWLVYVQRFDGPTAAMRNFRNTFPNFEPMRAHGEYM